MVQIDAITGQRILADGSIAGLRSERTGGLVTQDAHARFQEAVERGQVYTIQAKAVTVTAVTDITPLPATTGRVGVGIYNPLNSGVNLVIWKVFIAHLNGTPGGPAYLDIVSPDAACTDANKSNAINNFTLTNGGHKAKAYSAAVPGNTKAGVMIKPIIGSPTAFALATMLSNAEDLLDGSLVIPPGGFVGLTWHAAGTTHIYSASLSWEEKQV